VNAPTARCSLSLYVSALVSGSRQPLKQMMFWLDRILLVETEDLQLVLYVYCKSHMLPLWQLSNNNMTRHFEETFFRALNISSSVMNPANKKSVGTITSSKPSVSSLVVSLIFDP
jgi:hypothetical protein